MVDAALQQSIIDFLNRGRPTKPKAKTLAQRRAEAKVIDEAIAEKAETELPAATLLMLRDELASKVRELIESFGPEAVLAAVKIVAGDVPAVVKKLRVNNIGIDHQSERVTIPTANKQIEVQLPKKKTVKKVAKKKKS